MEMGTVNGWRVIWWEDKGIGEMEVQSMRKMGKYFFPNFLQPLRENVDRKNNNCYLAKVVNVALRRSRPVCVLAHPKTRCIHYLIIKIIMEPNILVST